MVSIGIRELKSRLSYYVQLMRAGETIAIRVRNRIVGFLTDQEPEPEPRPSSHRSSRGNIRKLLREWKREGYVLSGGLYRHRPIRRIVLKGGKSSTELLRELRDED